VRSVSVRLTVLADVAVVMFGASASAQEAATGRARRFCLGEWMA